MKSFREWMREQESEVYVDRVIGNLVSRPNCPKRNEILGELLDAKYKAGTVWIPNGVFDDEYYDF